MALILIVDDELAFRETLHHTFTQRGHKVVTAINADHAADLMVSQGFDLIVLDMRMPGGSGISLLKKIRDTKNPVPIVIYSVMVDAALEKEARQAGANEVLHKSVALEVLADRTERVLEAAGKLAAGPSSKKRQLLVVDDEKSIRQLLKIFFSKIGYEVQEAANGEEAVEKIKSAKPDIVLLDMRMGPGMNGIDTLRQILKLYPKLGVVMATGEANDEMVHKAMELGAYGYVLKPFDFLYLELVVSSKLTMAQEPEVP